MAKQNIEEFLVGLLKEAGCNGIYVHSDSITCQCPFHWNKSNFKTFRVSTVEIRHKKTGITNYYFNCFSCGESGTIPKIIAHINRCSYKKGSRLFQKRVVLSPVTLDGIKKELKQFAVDKKDILPEVDLPPISASQKPMLKYLRKRNKMYHKTLDIPYIINKYELYYCSKGRYAGRIIMPIRDEHGRVIGFNDRTISKNVKQKSLHKKGDEAGMMLHGLYQSRHKKYAVVTEGAFDMFAVDCATCDWKPNGKDYGAVNLMGVVMSDERLALLIQYFERVYLMLDHEEEVLEKIKQWQYEYKDDIEFIDCTASYPKGKDPAICTKKEIREALLNPTVNKRKPYLDYILEKTGFRV